MKIFLLIFFIFTIKLSFSSYSIHYSFGITSKDREFLQRAIQLASKGKGKTFPNPCVGCVLVSENGSIIGEGYHERCGYPHAEVMALRSALGGRIKNCTAYVTLEPCNHFSQTPPCTEALIKSGVKRVVVGMIDPDPRVSGKGVQYLRSHKIKVDLIGGNEEKMCKELNIPYIYRVLNNHTLPALLSINLDVLHHSISPEIIEEVRREIDILDTVIIDIPPASMGTITKDIVKIIEQFSNILFLIGNEDQYRQLVNLIPQGKIKDKSISWSNYRDNHVLSLIKSIKMSPQSFIIPRKSISGELLTNDGEAIRLRNQKLSTIFQFVKDTLSSNGVLYLEFVPSSNLAPEEEDDLDEEFNSIFEKIIRLKYSIKQKQVQLHENLFHNLPHNIRDKLFRPMTNESEVIAPTEVVFSTIRKSWSAPHSRY